MKALVIGHKKLQEEVKFWKEAYNISSDNKRDGYKLDNAQRALLEFEEIYKDKLATIKKYPFLAR